MKIVSIFSGIDNLGLGFSKNFDIVLCVEKEKNACRTIEKNKGKFHKDLKVWNRDMFTVSDEEIAKYKGLDGVIGGPSCQPFSPGKHGFDPNDERIKALSEYVRWVRIIEPKFFVMENTFGLMQKGKKDIYDFVKRQLVELGYNVVERILNAHDFGNVQNRERLIVIGLKKGLKVDFTFPSPVAEDKKKYVKDIIKDEPTGECMFYSEERKEIISHVPEGGYWKDLPTEELKKKALQGNYYNRNGGMTGTYRRLHRNNPCPTLVTNPCQRNTMASHPLQDRPLSVAEYKRAQGMPEDYEVLGTTSEKYKFIGNAVPFELAEAISNAVASSFEVKINHLEVNIKPKIEQYEQLRFA